ncbi:hypothetical protein ACNOYE_17920 [Nannocystaceae bacterium ST9]
MRRSTLGLLALTLACAPSEAPRVELPIVADGSGLAISTTDLGWTIEFEQARLAIGDLEFTTAGEVHEARTAEAGRWLLGLVLPSAHAHPGHYQGGEIIGELPGAFVLDLIAGDGDELGVATLIVGDYTAANFGLRRASADELPEGDPLIGHTAILAGTASAGEQVIAFSIVIDSPIDRRLVGAPFDYTVTEQSPSEGVELGVRLLDTDPQEGDHLFDGIDFAALDAADGAVDGVVTLIDPERDPALASEQVDAYNQIRRDFQTHDLFDIHPREP